MGVGGQRELLLLYNLMEKIDVERMSIKEIRRLLFEGKILNASSIVALYRALDFHAHKSAAKASRFSDK
jgi:hypothetical protein